MARSVRSTTPHWIEFTVSGAVKGGPVVHSHRVYFSEPVPLFHAPAHEPYSRAMASALRAAKAAAGLHPCTASRLLTVAPHDWSDSVEAVSEAFWAARDAEDARAVAQVLSETRS